MAAAWALKQASGDVKTTPGLLVGAVLSAAGAAVVNLKDGGASGDTMVTLRAAAAGTVVFCPAVPVAFKSLYCTVASGTVEVAIFYI